MRPALLSLLLILPAATAAPGPVSLVWKGLYEGQEAANTLSDTLLLGNAWMTLVFQAGDSDGWNDINLVRVRFRHATAATDTYNDNFAEFKFYPQDRHWSCLGPVSWNLNPLLSSGPDPSSTATSNHSLVLVFKPSPFATPTGTALDWRITVTVSDGTTTSNIVRYAGLRQIPPTSAPGQAALKAWPNPYRPSQGPLNLAFLSPFPEACTVDLDIFTVSGEPVRSLLRQRAFNQGEEIGPGPGQIPVIWDGKNDQGLPVVSGPYIARIRIRYAASKRSESFSFIFAVLR